MQDSISEKVADSLLINLSQQERRQLEKHYTSNPSAYNTYVLGVAAYNRRTKEGLEAAIEHFREAIMLDPSFALAYALLADSYYLQSYYGYRLRSEIANVAKAAAEKALALDDSVAETHLAIAWSQPHDDPGSAAYQSLRESIRLSPNLALAHLRYGWLLCGSGDLTGAVSEMRKAQALDPLSGTNNTALGILLIFARNYSEGLHYCQLAAELNKDEPFIQGNLATAYLLNGKYDEAIATFRHLDRINPAQHGDFLAGIAMVLSQAGRFEEAQGMLPEVLKLAGDGKVDGYAMTLLYLARSDKEEALNWFARTDGMAYNSPGLLRYDPQLDPLRGDPRFEEIKRKHRSDTVWKDG